MSVNRKNAHTVLVMTRAIEDAHNQVDRAIGKNAMLVTRLMEMREEAGVSGVAGQAQLEQLLSTLEILRAGRAALIDHHHSMGELAGDLGLVARSEGGLTKPPLALSSVPTQVAA